MTRAGTTRGWWASALDAGVEHGANLTPAAHTFGPLVTKPPHTAAFPTP